MLQIAFAKTRCKVLVIARAVGLMVGGLRGCA
jgi:hypothetical protein